MNFLYNNSGMKDVFRKTCRFESINELVWLF